MRKENGHLCYQAEDTLKRKACTVFVATGSKSIREARWPDHSWSFLLALNSINCDILYKHPEI